MEPGIYVRQNRGEIIANLVKETGKQRKNLCVYFKTYWKHDKAKNAFLLSYKNCGAPDKERCAGEQKRGRSRKYSDCVGVNVDDEMKAIFESAIIKYCHTRKEDTFQYAYEMMIRDRFTRFKVQPDGKTKAELLS
ncbi:hypothetical protein FACS1894105_14560 [Clostridia bacterium]|nr:hypothetical protein FACS1894105_14560 [Clostridia bacterium]